MLKKTILMAAALLIQTHSTIPVTNGSTSKTSMLARPTVPTRQNHTEIKMMMKFLSVANTCAANPTQENRKNLQAAESTIQDGLSTATSSNLFETQQASQEMTKITKQLTNQNNTTTP